MEASWGVAVAASVAAVTEGAEAARVQVSLGWVAEAAKALARLEATEGAAVMAAVVGMAEAAPAAGLAAAATAAAPTEAEAESLGHPQGLRVGTKAGATSEAGAPEMETQAADALVEEMAEALSAAGVVAESEAPAVELKGAEA
jgi:hypothetical protein